MAKGTKQQQFREKVLERDGYECQYCGSEYEPKNGLQAHHIVPVSEGGGFEVANGVTLCKQHHEAVHVLSGDRAPFQLLESNSVPKEIPEDPPLNSYVNLEVFDVLKDEYQVNPRLIREITGLERQRVNDALESLTDAGWVERRTRGLYRLVYDGDGFVTVEIRHRERD